MPRPKRTPKGKDAASEALLDDLMKEGTEKEERDAANDDPFLDSDGDLRVVPTMVDLSSLVSDEEPTGYLARHRDGRDRLPR
jgi:hypothetical protein